ncbi:hypothetical protein A2T98_16530 [Nodularia spumigena CENA596]|uniref:Uncharacterized protein n=1 Tax=Nodularia spumigena CENA596 TaxID=1819295 RepID=A0A166IPV8_NODSP|nr:hypothetical protein [Nodularia spumigena]KZL48681.1 hypothetical protein A2T98_16530 [Nodularia spumigena CENA596]
MTEETVVSSTNELLQTLGRVVLPTTIPTLIGIVDFLAQNNIKLEGEALDAVGMAFKSISGEASQVFESISKQLERIFKRIDEDHANRLSHLMADIATFDLPPDEKAKLFHQLISNWEKGVSQEKEIWRDIAKIGAIGGVSVALIAATAIGVKYARPKTIGDVLEQLLRGRKG